MMLSILAPSMDKLYVMHKNVFVTITTSRDLSPDRSLLLVISS